jgi:5'-3' exonuclease
MEPKTNWILIDGSYFIFYRYYALINWFKLAKKEQIIDKENPPFGNEEFLNKFKKTFISKMNEIKKKLNIENAITIVGKDCPRKTIWRMKHLESYKGNRVYDETFLGGPFFKLAYEDELFIKGGANKIMSYPELEADDCLAILTKKIKKTFPYGKIIIITSDMDYLQLSCNNVELYDLKFKKLTERKSSYNNAEKDLFVKIVTGDKSDNIKGVFKKCGPKTACKYFENRELFEEKLKKEEGSMERYLLNKKIIDFNEIPDNLVKGFMIRYNLL